MIYSHNAYFIGSNIYSYLFYIFNNVSVKSSQNAILHLAQITTLEMFLFLAWGSEIKRKINYFLLFIFLTINFLPLLPNTLFIFLRWPYFCLSVYLCCTFFVFGFWSFVNCPQSLNFSFPYYLLLSCILD